jgi:excisionase family DNA binding protein
MENVVFTQLSISEMRQLFRQEIERALSPLTEGTHSQTSDKEKLLTVQEAAAFLNLAVPTVYALCSRREIPHIKKRKRLYFAKAELLAWLQAGKQKTNTEIQAEAGNYLKKGRHSSK